MSAKIEKLKQRAALWRQKAEQIISSSRTKAEFQAAGLSAKADLLMANEEQRASERADKWQQKGNPDKAEQLLEAGSRIGLAKSTRWNCRADAVLVMAAQAAEMRAGLLRDKAAALEAEAAAEEARVQKAQQDAFNEETRNSR
jgi:hypothetical protein